MSAPSADVLAELQVEWFIPAQRTTVRFLASAHTDTPLVELLDPAHYCLGCGHCICAACQAVADQFEDV